MMPTWRELVSKFPHSTSHPALTSGLGSQAHLIRTRQFKIAWFIRCTVGCVCVMVLAALPHSVALPQAVERSVEIDSIAVEEPITPIPEPRASDPLKVKLGERLFRDPRLSRDNSRSCMSCHDIDRNGASRRSLDQGVDGSSLSLNTPTVFNAALSFRLGWEGKYRSLNDEAVSLLEAPHVMDTTLAEIARKLNSDPDVLGQFMVAYGKRPDASNVVDAITTFEQTLLTPGSRFDRWLKGDAEAISPLEINGYDLFKSLGCVSCHQGVSIGANLFERHGIFHPLASPKPEILRVPSLRNVATTGPYFHDGSAPTLDDAVRKMGLAQLNSTLTDEQVKAIVAYLGTLTGNFRGKPVGALP